ncbi:amidohydrolase [Solibacillus sp. FSL W7-1464]|uniref:amidohydrolase n=1 Tax=Solibacillus sp. FSL W7-1464 TaxID=2921706 RepID=UPI0030FCD938
MTIKQQLMGMLAARNDEMIAIRRHLHEHPELSFEEQQTAQYIMDFYENKDVKIHRNVGNGYGIIVEIQGLYPGPVIGIRADFDALPIEEETDVPFKSKNPGVMHACGHDGHTAYLLVLADCLIQLKEELHGTVKIIHQHAEEKPPGGAKSMMASGLLDDCEIIVGAHLFPTFKVGHIGYRAGAAMAGRSFFKLVIHGTGGHGSSPHLANDAIVAAANFVTTVQTVISRRLNPYDMGVVTIGSFDGKGTFNVIKDAVTLEGDVRYMNDVVHTTIEKEIKRLVNGLEVQFGVTCTLEYEKDYPPLVNDEDLTNFVVETLEASVQEEIIAVEEAPLFSGSEDFAYYALAKPSTFYYIGCQPTYIDVPYMNHHPKFDIDERALLVAAKAGAEVVAKYCLK